MRETAQFSLESSFPAAAEADLPRPQAGARPLVCLTDQECSVLNSWALRSDRLAKRAKVILAAALTDNVAHISRYAGLHRASVYLWRERFRSSRLDGIVIKEVAGLTTAQEQELENLQTGDDPRLARRAALILEITRTSDLSSAAARAGVRVSDARLGRRAFKRAGIDGLRPPQCDFERFLELSAENADRLRLWAEAGRPFSRRARIILALAQGEPVDTVAARIGVTTASVFYWRRCFLLQGLEAVAPKNMPQAQPIEREALKQLQSGSNAQVAKRASLLLDWLDSGDIVCAAKRHGVSLTSARNWRHAFESRGVDGLRSPKLPPPPPPPRSPLPLVVPMQLNVDISVKVNGQLVPLQGVTTTLASRCLTLSLNGSASRQLFNVSGARVTANVHWPAPRSNGKTMLLRIQGAVAECSCENMRVRIRKFEFTPAEE